MSSGRREPNRHQVCLTKAYSGVQLDVGAVFRDESAAVCEVSDVCQAADAARVLHVPVVGASLMLVLQSRQLDRLDVQTGVHQLPYSENHDDVQEKASSIILKN